MSNEKEKPIQHPEYEKAPMDRRQFFRKLVTAGGIAGGVSYVSFAPANMPGSLRDPRGLRSVPKSKPFTLQPFTVAKPNTSTPDVGIARGTRVNGEFSQDHLARLVKAAIGEIGGLEHYIQKDDIVLIKPNVAFDRSPNLGATSNPAILETIIRTMFEAGAREVRVADNPIESPPDCFEKSKIREATERGGGRVYLPDPNSFRDLTTEGAELIQEWTFFHRPFSNVDKVIGLAPVKDHNLCHASMGIKNWYGLLGGTRNQFHQDINGIVSDLSIMLRPTLTILDGTNVLMENGPTGGDPSNVKDGDVVMAGIDPVALDAYAFEHVLERGKDFPRYLAKAEEKGAGKLDYDGRTKEVLIG